MLAPASTPAGAAPRIYLGFLDDETLRWGPDRLAVWNDVRAADASVARTVVRWDQIAGSRPAEPLDPFDPAYNVADLDEFVTNAQQRGVEVLLTLWGTPPWANAGAGPNVPPLDAGDFASFAYAVAERYSGAYPGLPFARFFSIWNEPNSPAFLQAADPPTAYAALVEAGYGAIKTASPEATVAAGETAARHAPGDFVDELALADPTLPFDAWAHHPYPPTTASSPDTPQRYPDVGLPELGRFGNEIDAAFGRRAVPLWISECAEPVPAVSPAQQATDLTRADVRLADGSQPQGQPGVERHRRDAGVQRVSGTGGPLRPAEQPSAAGALPALVRGEGVGARDQAIDTWWRHQDYSRTPRFDLANFSCPGTIGALDISEVRLPPRRRVVRRPRHGAARPRSRRCPRGRLQQSLQEVPRLLRLAGLAAR